MRRTSAAPTSSRRAASRASPYATEISSLDNNSSAVARPRNLSLPRLAADSRNAVGAPDSQQISECRSRTRWQANGLTASWGPSNNNAAAQARLRCRTIGPQACEEGRLVVQGRAAPGAVGGKAVLWTAPLATAAAHTAHHRSPDRRAASGERRDHDRRFSLSADVRRRK